MGLVAVVSALLLLGPALGPGSVLAYDLVPTLAPGLTPSMLGASTAAPRTLPSDATLAVLAMLMGSGPAQQLMLVAILALCGISAAALLHTVAPAAGRLALAAATLAGVWNPYVAERLAIGQWTILLGYALTGLLVRALIRARHGHGVAPACGILAVGGLGGANTMTILVIAVVAALAWPVAGSDGRRPAPLRAWLAALATAAAASAVWALPAIANGVRSAAEGSFAFRARADTPLGTPLSLLSGGGMWNAASHPPSRAAVLPALAATVVALAAVAALVVHVRRRRTGWIGGELLLAAGSTSLVVVLCSVLPGLRQVWDAALATTPGGGLLRDSHKLLACWVVLLAVGTGMAVQRIGHARVRAIGPVAAVTLAVIPLALLPTLLWGLGGRLAAVTVPRDCTSVAASLEDAPDGVVGLLPWSQYRRYAWNGERVSLSFAPRMIDQRLLVNDALLTSGGWVAGEDPSAALVTRALSRGADPVRALAAAGVRYLFIEKVAGEPDVGLPPAAAVLAQSPCALAVDLGPPGALPAAGPSGLILALGWVITLGGGAVVVLSAILRRRPCTFDETRG